jgi:ribosome-associated protein
MAAMERDRIRVTRSVVLPLAEVELRFSRSSGPGGQHANTAETRVEAVLDVTATTALSDAQRRRVLAKAGPALRAVAQDERSQLRNRELAVERLVQQLREALKVERRRVATTPTAASRERRLESKKRRAATKKLRRRAVNDADGV